MANITGTSHNDHRTGTSGADDFDMSQGGNDVVHGLGGADTFHFGATLTAKDHVFGGGGDDSVVLNGDYSGGVTLGAQTLTSVETLDLTGAFSYDLTFNDANVGKGKTLIVDASASSGGSVQLDGSAETNGRYEISGSAGDDLIAGGAGNDKIYGGDGSDTLFGGAGHDTIDGGNGNDIIDMGAHFDTHDRVNGGNLGDIDTLELSGGYSSGLVFNSTMMTNIKQIVLGGGHSYSLNLEKALFNSSNFVTLDGSALGAHDTLTVEVKSEKHSTGFSLIGGAGNDVLHGGIDYDTFVGGGGADVMTGGGSTDVFDYTRASDSTGANFDTIIGFDAHENFIEGAFTNGTGRPDAVDHEVRHGTLSIADFNADLRDDIGRHQLGAADAVLFGPDHGSLAGHLFLVVDQNGKAGYQPNQDLVIYLETPKHMNDFSTENFGTAG